MAPRLDAAELDLVFDMKACGKSHIQVHELLATRRARSGKMAPNLTTIRRALRGKTHRRARVEARGKNRLLSRSVVLKMNRVRKELIKKTKNDQEIRWKDVIKKTSFGSGIHVRRPSDVV